MRSVDGETQKLGFGEFAEYTYGEVLVGKPKYVVFPWMKGVRPPRYGEIHRSGHAENVGIIADADTGSSG